MRMYKIIFSVFFIGWSSIAAATHEPKQVVNLVIGTYTHGLSEGIYTSTLDLSSGELSPARLAFKGEHPTYLATSKKGVIYGAFRENNGQLTALANNNGEFDLINREAILGKDPCYISLSRNEQYIASANYNGANVSIFRLSASGKIEKSPLIIKLKGSSVHKTRQKSSHPHWVQWSPFDDNVLYVVDLGSDKVMKYTLNYATSEVIETSVAYRSLPGSGPRHLVFHPSKKSAYILNELTNSIDFVEVDSTGKFRLIKQKSTLPDEFQQLNKGAHITINNKGTVLYASNRGLNSIARFNLDKNGEMHLQDNVDTGGNWPRFFKLFENYGFLLVANKKSNNIVVFKVNSDGSLAKTKHQLVIDQPTFVDEY